MADGLLGGSPLRPGLSQHGGSGCLANVPEVLDWIWVLEMGWRVNNFECFQLGGTIQQQEAQHCLDLDLGLPGGLRHALVLLLDVLQQNVLHNLFSDSEGTCVKRTGVGC